VRATRLAANWGISTVGTKSWNKTFSSLVEGIEPALPHQIKKQFQEKNLYGKVVIPAFTSQTRENQRLSPPYSNFWFLPCSHPS
jgi:hypothetical protein